MACIFRDRQLQASRFFVMATMAEKECRHCMPRTRVVHLIQQLLGWLHIFDG
ncbi:hypothetical protein SAMN05192566_1348 [Methylophilus rhizosphaerae]|uniref:Uncharacterized protein n=1 Tax=Methylophilus rhizosphaerae TaxID=492660 RepID=A0A1G9BUH4_9PROT|nr:hypothetical protein SAMN05192566_1348 [Methylophilus rhizosphaerae]